MFGDNISVRIRGINAPEKKEKGYTQSRKIVKKLLESDGEIEIKNLSRGKYLRMIADVYVWER